MYFYLYDSFAGDSKHEKEISEIENYLTDLGIAGTIERVSIFKTIRDILRSAAKKGAKTIVVVGNDHTFREAIKFFPDFGITFGFIPLGAPNYIAQFLGIPPGPEACNSLSARIVEKIDIGRINDKYFLGTILIPKTKLTMRCDGKYNLTLTETGDIVICNTPFSEEAAELSNALLDPRDEKLDVFISTLPSSILDKVKRIFGGGKNTPNQSHLTAKQIKINLENELTLFADKSEITDKNFDIGIANEKIKLIIGKNRLF